MPTFPAYFAVRNPVTGPDSKTAASIGINIPPVPFDLDTLDEHEGEFFEVEFGANRLDPMGPEIPLEGSLLSYSITSGRLGADPYFYYSGTVTYPPHENWRSVRFQIAAHLGDDYIFTQNLAAAAVFTAIKREGDVYTFKAGAVEQYRDGEPIRTNSILVDLGHPVTAELSFDGEIVSVPMVHDDEPGWIGGAYNGRYFKAVTSRELIDPTESVILVRHTTSLGYNSRWQRLYLRGSNPNGGASVLQHRLGPLLTAYGSGSRVTVVSKPDNAASSFDGWGFPTLYHIGDPALGGPVGLLMQKRSQLRAEREWWIHKSLTVGRTWEAVRMVLSGDYVNATRCGTREGVEVMAAIRKSDNVPMVWRGDNLAFTFPALTAPVSLGLTQRNEVGSHDLVLQFSPGGGQSGALYESKDGGTTWAVMP